LSTTIKISVSASGNTELVAAQTGRQIRVLNYVIVAAGAVSVKFVSDAATDTDLTGAMPLAANGGVSSAYAPQAESVRECLFRTLYGEALSINLSGAVLVAGHLSYDLY